MPIFSVTSQGTNSVQVNVSVCSFLTETVQAECSIVKEITDMARAGRHGTEGVGTAGGQWIHAAGEQEDQQGPRIHIIPRILYQQHCHQLPKKIPDGERERDGRMPDNDVDTGLNVATNKLYSETTTIP